MPALYIFGGLPATGKSTLARQLARDRKAVHVRVDTIEQALRDAGASTIGPEGYVVASVWPPTICAWARALSPTP